MYVFTVIHCIFEVISLFSVQALGKYPRNYFENTTQFFKQLLKQLEATQLYNPYFLNIFCVS